MKYLDFKIVRSKELRLGHMGKQKMPNTVFLQLSFGIDGFFLKMYMWCCKKILMRKASMVFKCCGDSSFFDNVFDEFLWIFEHALFLEIVKSVSLLGWKNFKRLLLHWVAFSQQKNI